MTNLNCLIVPKNLKEGTLWDFYISIMLQNIFIIEGGPFRDIKKFSKKTKNRRIRILSQSHSAENLERGDPLGFSKLQFAVKYRKIRREDPLDTKQIRKKVAQCRKKLKGGTL